MSIPPTYTITTDRLLLKHVTLEDLPFVFDATRYEGFNDGMLWEPLASQDELLPHLESSAISWKNDTGYSFSIWTQESPATFIGRISIRKTETDKIYDIGYWTHPDVQGKGYMTEAARAMLDFGFNALNALEISACYATWNIASKRVLEKIGMEQRMYIAEGFKKKGQWVAEYQMSIKRAIWKKMKDVLITQEPIQLYKLLKLESMVTSGGEAKAVIADGLVTVNGEVETRKRKQIVAGDVVTFGEETIKVRLA